jgi:hypothetical protein
MNTPPSSPPSAAPPNPQRKRGAPTGNINALKHGFYSRRFNQVDLLDIDSCRDNCLSDEIRLLRVFTRHFVDVAQDQTSYTEMLSVLRTLCLASTTLTRLLKTEKFLARYRV